MDNVLKMEEKQVLKLEDGRLFYYSVQPFEITNFLGAAVAVLREYFISDSTGSFYKLYRTNEGNWYDMPEENKGMNKLVLMSLKNRLNQTAIDEVF